MFKPDGPLFFIDAVMPGSASGDGGNGGAGGNGGNGYAEDSDHTLFGDAGGDELTVTANATGGDGGLGGKGGDVADGGTTVGTSGVGGVGGIGGAATVLITRNLLDGGDDNDILEIKATAFAGDGGFGGSGGSAGRLVQFSDTSFTDQRTDFYSQTSGVGGRGGDGGDVDVTISDNTLLGGNGDDTLTIDVEAAGGTGGTGGNSGDAGSNGSAASQFVVDGQAGVDVFHLGTAGATGATGSDGDTTVTVVNNVLDGGAGEDLLVLNISTPTSASLTVSGNTFDGGDDDDTLDFSGLAVGSGITVDLAGQSVIIAGGVNTVRNIETVIGTNDSDTFVGSTASETATGGGDGDTFVFADAASGVDMITDFVSTEDVLQIVASGFGGGLTAGGTVTLETAADYTTITGGPSGYFIYDTGGADANTVYWDETGGNGADAVAIVRLQSGASLVESDFDLA
jgi:hypothetical protein